MYKELKELVNKDIYELIHEGFVKNAQSINKTLLSQMTESDLVFIDSSIRNVHIDREYFLKIDKLNSLRKNLLYQDLLPQYYTGKLNSRIVYVGLNPRPGNLFYHKDGNVFYQSKNKKEIQFNENPIVDFESYDKYVRDFGRHKVRCHYNSSKNKKDVLIPQNKFDGKQLAFFAGFEGKCMPEYKTEELIELRENRLQLELIPYASLEFKFSNFKENLREQVKRILNIINEEERDVILFSGKVLEAIQTVFTKEELNIKENEINNIIKNKLNFPVATIPSLNYRIGIVQSFPNQGLQGRNMYEYGKLCREAYYKND